MHIRRMLQLSLALLRMGNMVRRGLHWPNQQDFTKMSSLPGRIPHNLQSTRPLQTPVQTLASLRARRSWSQKSRRCVCVCSRASGVRGLEWKPIKHGLGLIPIVTVPPKIKSNTFLPIRALFPARVVFIQFADLFSVIEKTLRKSP